MRKMTNEEKEEVLKATKLLNLSTLVLKGMSDIVDYLPDDKKVRECYHVALMSLFNYSIAMKEYSRSQVENIKKDKE